MLKLYRFGVDCGRMGSLDGLFTCEDTDLAGLYGKTVYFGEVLGKHSDISIKMDKDMFVELTDDPNFIQKFEEFDLATGFNPFNYIEEEESE